MQYESLKIVSQVYGSLLKQTLSLQFLNMDFKNYIIVLWATSSVEAFRMVLLCGEVGPKVWDEWEDCFSKDAVMWNKTSKEVKRNVREDKSGFCFTMCKAGQLFVIDWILEHHRMRTFINLGHCWSLSSTSSVLLPV